MNFLQDVHGVDLCTLAVLFLLIVGTVYRVFSSITAILRLLLTEFIYLFKRTIGVYLLLVVCILLLIYIVSWAELLDPATARQLEEWLYEAHTLRAAFGLCNFLRRLVYPADLSVPVQSWWQWAYQAI